jgi:hypothetical protein
MELQDAVKPNSVQLSAIFPGCLLICTQLSSDHTIFLRTYLRSVFGLLQASTRLCLPLSRLKLICVFESWKSTPSAAACTTPMLLTDAPAMAKRIMSSRSALCWSDTRATPILRVSRHPHQHRIQATLALVTHGLRKVCPNHSAVLRSMEWQHGEPSKARNFGTVVVSPQKAADSGGAMEKPGVPVTRNQATESLEVFDLPISRARL